MTDKNHLEDEEELEPEIIDPFDIEVKWSIRIAMTAFVVVYLIYSSYFFFSNKIIVPDPAAWGQFGDFVGGVLNPLVAALAFFWLVRSMQLQKAELNDTRQVMRRSVEEQKKQAKLVRKQNLIAELEIDISIKLVELEGLQTERIGIMNRVISQPKPTADHYIYGNEAGKNLALPEVVNVLDSKIETIKHDLNIIKGQIKRINHISDMAKTIERLEDDYGF